MGIIVEIPYQILLGIMVFASYFYPIYTRGGIPDSQRQGLILLLLVQFFVFASTFAHMMIAALPDAETAGNIATLMFSMCLTFNGVFQPPFALPGFWIFMYRVSPLTYLVSAVASTGLSGRHVRLRILHRQSRRPIPLLRSHQLHHPLERLRYRICVYFLQYCGCGIVVLFL